MRIKLQYLSKLRNKWRDFTWEDYNRIDDLIKYKYQIRPAPIKKCGKKLVKQDNNKTAEVSHE